MPYRRNSTTPNFVNAWFAVKFAALGWRVLLWVTGALMFTAFAAAYWLAGPTIAQNGLVWFLYGTTIIGVLSFVVLVLTIFLRILQFLTGTGRFNPVNRPTINDTFGAIGLVPNPPEPWFGPDGAPLYVRTPAGWAKIANANTAELAPKAPG